MLIAALVLATALQDPPPAPPPVIRLDPQIQRWLDDSSAATGDRERGPIWDDGRIHGEVSVSVGSDGWRAWGGELDVPVGTGRMSLRLNQSEGGDDWGAWPHEAYDRHRRSPGPPRAMQERPAW